MNRSAIVVTLVYLTLAHPLTAQERADSAHSLRSRTMLAGLAVVAAAMAFDAPIARSMLAEQTPDRLIVARQFDRLGDVTGIAPIVGGLALAGLITHHSPLVRAAIRAAGSVAVATVLAQGGKYAFGRVRPDGDPDLDGFDFRFFAGSPSFPSGHTAAAFAMATSLGDELHNRWATTGFYLLAGATGWARMAESRHWLSDVIAGAAVGTVSAKFVSGRLRLFGRLAPELIATPGRIGLRWNPRLN